jgi:hypothetical protein
LQKMCTQFARCEHAKVSHRACPITVGSSVFAKSQHLSGSGLS